MTMSIEFETMAGPPTVQSASGGQGESWTTARTPCGAWVWIAASIRVPLPHSGESSLELVSLYWHFVDGMWVLIYGVVYFWSAFLLGGS